jgi:hypothetical protein
MEERILSRASDKRAMTGLVVEAGKFNRNTNEDNMLSDRKEMMEALLKEYADGDNEDEDNEETVVPDDSQLNMLLAIHESEIELYQQVDNEREQIRIEQWKKVHGSAATVPGRLMAINEVPSWICQQNSWQQKYTPLYNMLYIKDESKDIANYASIDIGPRKRKHVQYTDGISEAQFLKQCELLADEESQSKASTCDTPLTMSSDPLSDNAKSDLGNLITQLNRTKGPDGSYTYVLFIEKPDRTLYPDYYSLIPQPISLKAIQVRFVQI